MADGNPAQVAAAQFGSPMMGELGPFPTDSDIPDNSRDIADIFGLGAEAGPVANAPNGDSGGGASPPAVAPAAEGGEGQSQPPATPPTPQTPGQQGELPPTPAPASQPAAPPVTPEPVTAPAPDQNTQALQAQVQALIAQNAQLLERMSQGAGSQAPQPGPNGQQGQQQPQGEADPYMDYRFAIPDDVAGAIFNEDPAVARQGMTHLVNSLGRIVHERVLRSVQERVLPQHLSQFGQQLTQTQQQEQMRNEYFNSFPQHNDPGIRVIVAQEAQALWTANPTLSWDANARNALGARVQARLTGAPIPQQQPAAAPLPPVVPAPRPAAQMGASSRQSQSAPDEGDFMTSVLTA